MIARARETLFGRRGRQRVVGAPASRGMTAMADNIALPDPNAHVQALIRANPDELLERSGTYGTETTLTCGWRSSRNGP